MNVKTILQVVGTIFGAYFGAKVAGQYAIRAVEKQIQHDRDNRRREELDSILKTYLVFLVSYGTYNDKLNELLAMFSEEENQLSDDFFDEVDRFNHNATNTYNDLSQVRTDLLPFEQYRTSLEVLKRIKLINSIFEHTVPTFKNQSDRQNIDIVFLELEDQLEQLQVHYNRLKKFELQQKLEFNKLEI